MHSTPGFDVARTAEIDSAGNVYAAGLQNADATYSQGTAFVAAWNASGTPLWNATFDSVLGHAEFPTAIAFDGAGGLYVVGGAIGATSDAFATFLLHIDAAGVITWSVEQPITANGLGGAWIPSLVVDAQGRAIVGDRGPSGSGDLEITAYTPAGAVAWQTTYAGSAGGVDRVVDLALAPNGEIVAIGTVNAASTTSATGAPVLVRLAPDGTVLQTLEIVHHFLPHGFGVDVEVDAQGRIFVAATSRPASYADRLIVLLAFDAQGIFSWARSIDGPAQGFGGGAWATDLEIDAFGRAIVMGARAQGYAGYELVIAAYDVNGNEAWRNIVNDVLGGPATELFNTGVALLLDGSGEATAVGNYASANVATDFTQCDTFAFAIDAPGQKRFGFAYGFPGTPQGSLDYAFAAAAGTGPSFVIAGQAQTGASSTDFDAFVTLFTRTAVGFCYGDGLAAACPCGNVSPPVERAGCASTLGVGGRLADLGASSVSNDTLELVGTSMPNAFTLYFQGTLAVAGATFGDGLLCASGTLVRLGNAVNVAGTSRYPESGDLPISVRGQVSGPGTRVYQAAYRNGAMFCTPGTFNSTNGLRVTWVP